MKARARQWCEDSPANLAVFRFSVAVVVLMLPDLHGAARWAVLSDAVRTPPVGLGWAVGVWPFDYDVARAAYLVVLAATLCGGVGLASRLSWTVVTVVGVYLLGIPQFSGAVFHYHHVLWFAALLAASPCGDALSVDRLLARRRGRPAPPARSVAYGVPLRAAWILVGFIYFFPGLWKLITSGIAWFWSDNLTNQMYAKWAQKPHFEPLFRIDRHPMLVRLGALAVVIFELGFLPAIFFRRTRLAAVAAAIAFHHLTAWFMSLRFPALWLTYVMFVDWPPVAAWVRRRLRRDEVSTAPPTTLPAPSVRPALAVGAVLLVANLGFGAAGVSDGWPFACYPKFDRTVSARLPALEVELVAADGSVTGVPVEMMHPAGRTQRWWAMSWSLMGAHEHARASPGRFRAFWSRVSRRPDLREASRDAVAVRFYRAVVSTVPEERGDPPLSRRLLYELPLR